jgi:soluble lytic murein transglycosylase-like protein
MVIYAMIVPSRLPAPPLRRGRLGAVLLAAFLWLAAGNLSHAAGQQALDREAFLRAIAEVETGGNSRAVGRRGERGMYQFGRTTWRQYTSRPHSDAHIPVVAHGIAVRHFDWLQAELARNGRQPTPYLMAVAWNGGVGRAIGGRAPFATRDYATRVSNLTAMFQPKPAPLAAPAAVLADNPEPVSLLAAVPAQSQAPATRLGLAVLD